MLKDIKLIDYVYYKNLAYEYVKVFRTLSLDQKLDYIKYNLGELKNRNKDLAKLFVITLFFPNDLDIANTLNEGNNLTEIANKLNMSPSALVIKVTEFNLFNFDKLIKENKLNKNLANQKPVKFEEENDLTTIVDTIFPNQIYNKQIEKHNKILLKNLK